MACKRQTCAEGNLRSLIKQLILDVAAATACVVADVAAAAAGDITYAACVVVALAAVVAAAWVIHFGEARNCRNSVLATTFVAIHIDGEMHFD